MFAHLGRGVARRPWLSVLVWMVIAVSGYGVSVFGIAGESVFDRVKTGAPGVPGSPSDQADILLREHFAADQGVALLVTGIDPLDPAAIQEMSQVTQELASIPGVSPPLSPYSFPEGPGSEAAAPWRGLDGESFLITVQPHPGSDAAITQAVNATTTRLDTVADRLGDATGQDGISGIVSSTDRVVSAVTDQSEKDLSTGERASLPVALVVMVMVFGGFLAASMPMVGALASIGSGLGALWCFTYVLDVDASVINIVSVLAVGLSIDYGLLIVSRFRDELLSECELAGGLWSREAAATALVTTMQTAGRTVVFSAVTVALSIAGLLVFQPPILRSIGAGGLAAVVVAAASAVTVVPAVLMVTSRRLAAPSVLTRVPGIARLVQKPAADPRQGFLYRWAAWVQRHPWLVSAVAVTILTVLALPVLSLEVRNSGIEILPAHSEQREFVDRVAADYPLNSYPPITVVSRVPAHDAEELRTQLAHVDSVSWVDAPVMANSYAMIGVRLDTEHPGGPEATQVVRDLRALKVSSPIWVSGQAATQIDFVDAVLERMWVAGAIVAVATLVLLFLMTGSLVVPIKALVMNIVSLSASLGVLVWAFQEGHLESVLNFSSPGGIETYVVAMVVAFAFGLAMDYEVFLLARVKEMYDHGLDNDEAVRQGLHQSGRIITSAATIIVLVFAGFMFGELIIIKEVGFALAIAVIVDATLVRLLLVPATMTLLGRYNWWAPRWMTRLYGAAGLKH